MKKQKRKVRTKYLEYIKCPRCGKGGRLRIKLYRGKTCWCIHSFVVTHTQSQSKGKHHYSTCYLGTRCPSLEGREWKRTNIPRGLSKKEYDKYYYQLRKQRKAEKDGL